MKKIYRAEVSWQVCGVIEVEAESLEEAQELIDAAPLPTDSDYLEGSFIVDSIEEEE